MSKEKSTAYIAVCQKCGERLFPFISGDWLLHQRDDIVNEKNSMWLKHKDCGGAIVFFHH